VESEEDGKTIRKTKRRKKKRREKAVRRR